VSQLNIVELLNEAVLEFGNNRFMEGWFSQQERIIKILKEQGVIADVDAVIALIKGENK
jgi:hypothetical protein